MIVRVFALLMVTALVACARPTQLRPPQTPLAGTWRVAVQGMDGQRGTFRIGPSGVMIGLLYAPRRRLFQHLSGKLDPDGHVSFRPDVSTARFPNPSFQQIAQSASIVRGTWWSGESEGSGPDRNVSTGTWRAQRSERSVLEGPPLAPPMPAFDRADVPEMTCRITAANGRQRTFTARPPNLYFAAYDTVTGAVTVSTNDGRGATLSFPPPDGTTPHRIDVTDPTDGNEAGSGTVAASAAFAQSVAADGGDGDAATYQAATGRSPGWWMLTSQRWPPFAPVIRLRGIETFAIVDGLRPVPRGDSYDFRPSRLEYVACTVVIDVPARLPNFVPTSVLERAVNVLR